MEPRQKKADRVIVAALPISSGPLTSDFEPIKKRVAKPDKEKLRCNRFAAGLLSDRPPEPGKWLKENIVFTEIDKRPTVCSLYRNEVWSDLHDLRRCMDALAVTHRDREKGREEPNSFSLSKKHTTIAGRRTEFNPATIAAAAAGATTDPSELFSYTIPKSFLPPRGSRKLPLPTPLLNTTVDWKFIRADSFDPQTAGMNTALPSVPAPLNSCMRTDTKHHHLFRPCLAPHWHTHADDKSHPQQATPAATDAEAFYLWPELAPPGENGQTKHTKLTEALPRFYRRETLQSRVKRVVRQRGKSAWALMKASDLKFWLGDEKIKEGFGESPASRWSSQPTPKSPAGLEEGEDAKGDADLSGVIVEEEEEDLMDEGLEENLDGKEEGDGGRDSTTPGNPLDLLMVRGQPKVPSPRPEPPSVDFVYPVLSRNSQRKASQVATPATGEVKILEDRLRDTGFGRTAPGFLRRQNSQRSQDSNGHTPGDSSAVSSRPTSAVTAAVAGASSTLEGAESSLKLPLDTPTVDPQQQQGSLPGSMRNSITGDHRPISPGGSPTQMTGSPTGTWGGVHTPAVRASTREARRDALPFLTRRLCDPKDLVWLLERKHVRLMTVIGLLKILKPSQQTKAGKEKRERTPPVLTTGLLERHAESVFVEPSEVSEFSQDEIAARLYVHEGSAQSLFGALAGLPEEGLVFWAPACLRHWMVTSSDLLQNFTPVSGFRRTAKPRDGSPDDHGGTAAAAAASRGSTEGAGRGSTDEGGEDGKEAKEGGEAEKGPGGEDRPVTGESGHSTGSSDSAGQIPNRDKESPPLTWRWEVLDEKRMHQVIRRARMLHPADPQGRKKNWQLLKFPSVVKMLRGKAVRDLFLTVADDAANGESARAETRQGTRERRRELIGTLIDPFEFANCRFRLSTAAFWAAKPEVLHKDTVVLHCGEADLFWILPAIPLDEAVFWPPASLPWWFEMRTEVQGVCDKTELSRRRKGRKPSAEDIRSTDRLAEAVASEEVALYRLEYLRKFFRKERTTPTHARSRLLGPPSPMVTWKKSEAEGRTGESRLFRPVVRRQEMPEEWDGEIFLNENAPEAIATGDAAVFCFFCPAATESHPDPSGFHFAELLEVFEQLDVTAFGFDSDVEPLIFWDFISLHQIPRTVLEQKAFELAQSDLELWWGHTETVALFSVGSEESTPFGVSFDESLAGRLSALCSCTKVRQRVMVLKDSKRESEELLCRELKEPEHLPTEEAFRDLSRTLYSESPFAHLRAESAYSRFLATLEDETRRVWTEGEQPLRERDIRDRMVRLLQLCTDALGPKALPETANFADSELTDRDLQKLVPTFLNFPFNSFVFDRTTVTDEGLAFFLSAIEQADSGRVSHISLEGCARISDTSARRIEEFVQAVTQGRWLAFGVGKSKPVQFHLKGCGMTPDTLAAVKLTVKDEMVGLLVRLIGAGTRLDEVDLSSIMLDVMTAKAIAGAFVDCAVHGGRIRRLLIKEAKVESEALRHLMEGIAGAEEKGEGLDLEEISFWGALIVGWKSDVHIGRTISGVAALRRTAREAWETVPPIIRLDLSQSSLTKREKALLYNLCELEQLVNRMIANPRLTEIRLSHLEPKHNETAIMAGALSTMRLPALTILSFSHSEIDDNGLAQMVFALLRQPQGQLLCLTELGLERCEFLTSACVADVMALMNEVASRRQKAELKGTLEVLTYGTKLSRPDRDNIQHLYKCHQEASDLHFNGFIDVVTVPRLRFVSSDPPCPVPDRFLLDLFVHTMSNAVSRLRELRIFDLTRSDAEDASLQILLDTLKTQTLAGGCLQRLTIAGCARVTDDSVPALQELIKDLASRQPVDDTSASASASVGGRQKAPTVIRKALRVSVGGTQVSHRGITALDQTVKRVDNLLPVLDRFRLGPIQEMLDLRACTVDVEGAVMVANCLRECPDRVRELVKLNLSDTPIELEGVKEILDACLSAPSVRLRWLFFGNCRKLGGKDSAGVFGHFIRELARLNGGPSSGLLCLLYLEKTGITPTVQQKLQQLVKQCLHEKDRYVSPSDALAIINSLPSLPQGESVWGLIGGETRLHANVFRDM